MAERVQFTGTIEKIFFQKPERDYVIGQLLDEQTRRPVRFLGTFPQAAVGQYWQIEGVRMRHPVYGEQIEVDSALQASKPVADRLVRYLAGGQFEGIGRRTAQAVVESLGEDCIDQIVDDPSILETKCHLRPSTARKISEPLRSLRTFGHQITPLLKWGLSRSEIDLLKEFSDTCTQGMETFCSDPFLPYYRVSGFGYQAGVKLADGYRLEPDSPKRIEAALFHELSTWCFRTGSTCLEGRKLQQKMGLSPQQYERALEQLEQRGLAIEEDGRLYLLELYESERTIARRIYDHIRPVEKIPSRKLEQILAQVEKETAICYDPAQKQAIHTFLDSSLMILNGGPGTGKSTILLGLLKVLHQLFPAEKITLCAPTGRAARRMKDLSHVQARTIHSLLRWNPQQDSFSADEHDPLSCRFLIVDEFSMVDSRLCASLLRAVPETCQILLIGDEDQLESVGPGNVLRDLIESQKIPVVHLETLHRQKEGSGIPILATQIRKEEPVIFLDPVRFLSPAATTLSCLKERVLLEEDPESLQILAPKYDGDSGIHAINSMMQEIVNPFDPNKTQLVTHISTAEARRQIIFRVDDKVLLKRNFPELNAYNGDIGRIIEIDPVSQVVTVNFADSMVEFEKGELNLLSHAWCISIHKSQGSEYPKACVIADANGAGMLRKRLLYTAVSRAKGSLTLIGDEALFRRAVRRSDPDQRQTTLQKRLEEVWSRSSL